MSSRTETHNPLESLAQSEQDIPPPWARASKRNASIINYVLGMLQVILITLNGIALVPLYIQRVGLSMYGAWIASTGVLSMLSTMEAGLGSVLTHHLSRALSKQDLTDYSTTALSGIMVAIVVGIAFSLTGITLSPFFPGWFHIQGSEAGLLSEAVILVTLNTALTIVAQTIGALPQACQRPMGMGLALTGSLLITFIVTIGLVLHGMGVVALGLGLLVGTVFQFISYVVIVLYHWRLFTFPRPEWSILTMKTIALQMGPLLLARASNAIGQNSEASVSASSISPTATAILTISGRAVVVVQMVVGQIASATFAGISWVHGSGDAEKTYNIFLKLLRLNAALLSIGLGLTLAFNDPLVSLWVGADKFGGYVLTLLIVISQGLQIRNKLFGSFLEAMGQFKKSAYLEMGEVAIRLLFMVFLARVLGITGIVLSSLLAAISLKTWLLPRLIARSLNQGPRLAIKLASTGLVLFSVCFAEGLSWHLLVPTPKSWIPFIVQVSLCTILMVGTMMLDRSIRELVLSFIPVKVVQHWSEVIVRISRARKESPE